MDADFTAIQIACFDDKASRPIAETKLVTAVFALSALPPAKWAEYFDAAWARHIYTMKRPARAIAQTIEIECATGEIKDEHLPELQKIVATVNDQYAQFTVYRAKEKEALMEDEVRLRNELKAVKESLDLK